MYKERLGGPVRDRRRSGWAASVDTAPVLKYNLHGYFSAAIHVSVSDSSIPPLVRADGGIFSLSLEIYFCIRLILTTCFYL